MSIGLAVYNGERYLEETLTALLGQTHGDFELLIADNASTDRTAEIARGFCERDERVSYHCQPENIGLGGNFNFLARSLHGEFFKWATADDVCEPQFLERCYAVLDEKPEVALAYPRTQFIDDAGASLDFTEKGFDLRSESVHDRLRYVILSRDWVNATLGLIRKSVLDQTRLLPTYPGGDFALLAQIVCMGQIYEVPEKLFRRRIHSRSSSQIQGDMVQMTHYLDSRAEGARMIYWLRARDELGTIFRAPISALQKFDLGRVLLRKMYWERSELSEELAMSIRGRRWTALRRAESVARPPITDPAAMQDSSDGQTRAERWRSLTNVASNWGAFVITAIANFLLSPFIVHTLGDTAYGAWVLLASLVGYLGLLDLGVRGAVTKYVATHHAAGNHEQSSRMGSAALAIFGVMALASVAFSFGLALLGLPLFDIPPELQDVGRSVLMIGGVTIAFTLVGGVYGGVVVGLQRFDLVNAVSVVIALIRVLAIVLALQRGGGLLALAIVQLGVAVTQGIASYWLSRRVYPEIRLRVTTVTLDDVRTVFSFGIFASLLFVAGSIINYTDSIVIGAFLPIGMITFFAISANLVEYGVNVIRGITGTIAPMTGALEGANRTDRVSEVLVTGARYATLVSMPIVATFILRGASFIGLWMGPGYAEPAGEVLIPLAVGLWVLAGFQVNTNVMLGINKHRGLVPAFGIEAVANVVLSVVLLQHYGILGVALGTLIPRLVVCLFFGPWYAQQVLGLSMRQYWWETFLVPTCATAPFALASWATEMYWPATGLAMYFAQVVLALPFFALGAWLFFLKPTEKELLVNASGRLMRSLGVRA